MNKTYQKPEVDLLKFNFMEAIANEAGNWTPDIDGSEGYEEL